MTTAVAVFGSSGSIGTQTLDIVRASPERYRISALGVGSSVDALVAAAHEFRPEIVVLADERAAAGLAERLPPTTALASGADACAQAIETADTVVNGVVGFAGLEVTMAALQARKRLCLANKESLIAAGPVVRRAWEASGAELIPVDSEHCAIHQCLRAGGVHGRVTAAGQVDKIVLTASGGPFRGRTRSELESVTVEQALAHPTWSMGPKITVDSSTLMNKGLEVIEAHELFGVSFDDIDVVVHPQSVVHSMVTFEDGATLAQLSMPDMRLCIGYALAYPQRSAHAWGAIDWAEVSRLDFAAVDHESFACLGLAYAAGRSGETAPAWLSAANEVAVEAFLAGRIGWLDIAALADAALQRWPGTAADGIDAVLEADRAARATTAGLIAERVLA